MTDSHPSPNSEHVWWTSNVIHCHWLEPGTQIQKQLGVGEGGGGRSGEAIDLNAAECGYYSRLDEG